MPKVICATIECKHNKNNRCKAKDIHLADGHVNTVHQGYKHIWECRFFEMDDEGKKIFDSVKGFFASK